jgi:CxxC motif-containing protein
MKKVTEEKVIICIGCPKGCSIKVMHDGGSIQGISGYTCKNGLEYAKNEFTSPKRILTSTVRIKNGVLPLLPVKTKGAISKDKIFECMKEISGITLEAPVVLGTVIKSDIGGTGVDLVATRSIGVKRAHTA